MKVAVDTGGTFTDVVYIENGVLKSRKVPSTPKDPSEAVLNGVKGFSVSTLIHGTTVGTNAFLERKGAKVAFITTKGFKDILFIGRQNRPKLYSLFPEKPRPIVLPENCFEVKERLDAKGNILEPLKEEEVRELKNELLKKGIESVAVCLLHSYLYPAHEQKIKNELSKDFRFLSLSSEVLPEFREFERASTTTVNAYLSPIMTRYLKKLASRLKGTQLYVQQSNGGWMRVEEAGKLACHTILSGPAGGVSGALMWGKLLGYERLITFDMGGTSTDVCLVDGRIPFTKDYEVDGYPICIPVIDIHTVGAGGGSIAYIDVGGALKVGPISAGADPGPACYGKGDEPTVTDANLVLGRLLPDGFLGGRFKLYEDRAKRVIFEKVAKPLGMSLEEAALGIIKVANTNMVKALRKVSVERGFNPEEFVLFCFGGAGALHACSLARELKVKKILIPKCAGTFSAFGLLTASMVKDISQTVWINAEDEDLLKEAVNKLAKKGEDYLAKANLPRERFSFEFFVDARYKGQGFELTIPLKENLASSFEEEHLKYFGYTCKGFPIEVVTLRLRLRAKDSVPSFSLYRDTPQFSSFSKWVVTEKGKLEVKVIPWDSLKEGEELKGPLLIVEEFTTVWVEPEFKVKLREPSTLELELTS